MTPQEFDSQMRRMENRWKNTYTDELKKLIWQEFGNSPTESFRKVISKLIGEERFAPLMNEFRREASAEREKTNQENKRDHTKDSWEFWRGSGQASSSPEEQSWMFQAIRQRLKKEMPDDDWNAFMKLIESRFGRQAKVLT